jgi:hypothetical protein
LKQIQYHTIHKHGNNSYPEDGALVGTAAIFSSPNVLAPINAPRTSRSSRKDDGIPAPSIFYDIRGEIHNIKVNNNQRINVLYTKAGFLRSGDIHPNVQCDFIFSGRVKVWTLLKDGSTSITSYEKHDFIEIPKGVPHIFEFVEDTVMAEWWEPQGFQAWFYKPYREIVDKSFQTMMKGTDGLHGMDEFDQRGMVLLVHYSDKVSTYKITGLLMAGLACAGLAGFVLGSKSRAVTKTNSQFMTTQWIKVDSFQHVLIANLDVHSSGNDD